MESYNAHENCLAMKEKIAMAASRVAYVADINSRAEYIKNLAPPDLEVVMVDIRLSDEEKIHLCRDADAIISSDVSVNVLRQCPRVKLIQTLSAGYDRLDLEAIGEMGIPIANNGGGQPITVCGLSITPMSSLC